jgi:hypothetical protein
MGHLSFTRHWTYLSRGAKRHCASVRGFVGLAAPKGRKTIRTAFFVRSTSCSISRNGNDSAQLPAKLTCSSPNQTAACADGGKNLNLLGYLKCRSMVMFLALAQNKFTNRLRSSAAELNF